MPHCHTFIETLRQRGYRITPQREMIVEIVAHGGRHMTADEVFEQELDLLKCDAVIGGHCGLPFTRFVSGRVWHNSGALGLPANDGTPRVWYSVLSPEGSNVRVEHHALEYAHDQAAENMQVRGLPQAYAEALQTGRCLPR